MNANDWMTRFSEDRCSDMNQTFIRVKGVEYLGSKEV